MLFTFLYRYSAATFFEIFWNLVGPKSLEINNWQYMHAKDLIFIHCIHIRRQEDFKFNIFTFVTRYLRVKCRSLKSYKGLEKGFLPKLSADER